MYQTYVVFMLPGSFVSEQEVRKVDDRCFPQDIPRAAFAFYFYDVFESIGPRGEVVKGQPQNVSAKTYFGEAFALERVKSEVPHAEILISNMKVNGWDRVVWTRLGNWQPLEPDDVVIDGIGNWTN